MTERYRRELLECKKKPGNNVCADCGAPEPEWTSTNLGIFICINCCGVHRRLGTSISIVRSLLLDAWTDDKLKVIREKGNELSNKIWENQVPVCYRRPDISSPQVLREQWIRSKYERQEFIEGAPLPSYLTGEKEGLLLKRGRNNGNWLPRKFILSVKNNSFAYFIRPTDLQPRDIWLLNKINAVFADDKAEKPNCLQIMNTIDGKTRSLFIAADTGKEIVEWYMTIRYAKLKMLKAGNVDIDEKELVKITTKDFVREGSVSKRGPRDKGWKDRWLCVDGRRVMYLEKATDAFPKGEFVLGTKGYDVTSGFNEFEAPLGYGFSIHTPDRIYEFSAGTEDERDEWVKDLKKIVSTSLTEEDRKAITLSEDLERKKSQQSSLSRISQKFS